jgi:collagen type V/XI/XXIV/XXVII, alpha
VIAVGAVPENRNDDPDNVPEGCMLDMYNAIYAMRKELEKVKRPHGTKENPARTCRDLYFGHPQFKDGTIISDCILCNLNI